MSPLMAVIFTLNLMLTVALSSMHQTVQFCNNQVSFLDTFTITFYINVLELCIFVGDMAFLKCICQNY